MYRKNSMIYFYYNRMMFEVYLELVRTNLKLIKRIKNDLYNDTYK